MYDPEDVPNVQISRWALILLTLGFLYVLASGPDDNMFRRAFLSSADGFQGLRPTLAAIVYSPAQSSVFTPHSDLEPSGNPLNDTRAVITQGYGVGSHSPAKTWGAIDLAVDGNSDGYADPEASMGRQIFATMSGKAVVSRDTWPAGNHLWIVGPEYKIGFSHLSSFLVSDGEDIHRGQIVALLGSTGQSSGPHLDYQIWHLENGEWVNKNPLDFHPLDLLK
jgi:murein DD-endopeptidase MepM/ murein hydrolase activator NlpD